MTYFFQKVIDNYGCSSGRLEYNTIFSQKTQEGAKKLAESKWPIANKINVDMCPVPIAILLAFKTTLINLYHKLILKKGGNRMILKPNPF